MNNEPCVFCKIIDGSIPAKRIHESDNFLCVADIQPQAKVHVLVFPKKHVQDLMFAVPSIVNNQTLENANSILTWITEVAKMLNLDKMGFRVVTNTGPWGGQTVKHLHFHLLGGEPLKGTFGA